MPDSNIMVAADIIREGLLVTVKITIPLLLVGLVVGLIVSFLQAITQIQEQTLSFVPKMAAVAAAMFLLAPWILTILGDYMTDLITHMGTAFRP